MSILFAHNFRPPGAPGAKPRNGLDQDQPLRWSPPSFTRTSGRSGIPAALIEGIAWLAEPGIMAAAGLWTFLLFVHPAGAAPNVLIGVILAVTALSVISVRPLDAYQVAAFRAPLRYGSQIALTWIAIFAMAYASIRVAGLSSGAVTLWLLYWALAALAGLGFERALLAGLASHLWRKRKFVRRTAIVGGGAYAETLLDQLTAQAADEVEIVGLFDDRMDHRSPEVVSGYPKLGTISDLVAFGQRSRIDLVIVALPVAAERRLVDIARKIWILPVDIRLSAHTSKLRLGRQTYSFIGGVPMIDLYDKPLSGWNLVVKNVFDRIVGLVLLLFAAPVMIAVAIAIKLDSAGPLLFRQKRYGFNNELIEVFKFRSMYERDLDYDATKLVTRGDRRVTRVGRFLRRTSLDELPQLFNVALLGNLSLVGPRPHAIHAKAADRLYPDVVDSYYARHRVRPGMTGWAQINGWRGETDTSEKIQKRVEYDLYYIENWSLLLDIYVLMVTPIAVIYGEGAF